MLVLSRKLGEKVVIGRSIVLTVVAVKGNRVRLAFDAPGHVRIRRAELTCGRQESMGSNPLDPQLLTATQ
jgi:carbon storage regulator